MENIEKGWEIMKRIAWIVLLALCVAPCQVYG